jgi:3-oxoacyl-[acyl-carrier protein] reductase
MLLEGKNIVITGCNRGIGYATLLRCVKEGANIWAVIREENLEFKKKCVQLEEQFNVSIEIFYCDMSDESQIKICMKTLLAEKRPIDVLINNAGISYNALCQMTSKNKLEEVMNVNFMAPYIMMQYVFKSMIKNRKGSIINIASTSGIDANPGRSAYGASKAALINTTKTLAAEVGKAGIRINAIAPGMTKTDMVLNNTPVCAIQETIEMTMLKRLGEPDEISNVIVFLASDQASFITGQTIRVDGGLG